MRKKEAKLYHALITVVLMIIIMFTAIVKFGAEPQIPLVFGCLIAGLVSLWIGYSWEEILEGMIAGITNSLEAVLILMLIGMLVGSWIACGTVPTMIYFGLKIVSPKIFLPATMLISLLVAFAIGSWGTVGTIGLAFMGIGIALNIPSPLVAGAVISGAYMGEIASPLSDATNLTAAVVGEDVFKIVKRVLTAGIFVAVIAVILYAVVGMKYAGGNALEIQANIQPLLENISAQFKITPIALVPMIIMIVCILLKLPAIAAMLIGSIVGMIEAVILQGAGIGDVLSYAFSGYVSQSGNEMIDNLLTAGGMEEMLNSISIIIIAMSFGGIMQHTRQMEALVKPIVSRSKSEGSLGLITVLTGIGMNIILPDQYLGISMPGQMYSEEYEKRGISKDRLATTLLGGGAVTSPLIPWNTCGIYCMTILSVAPLQYAPYAFFCLIMPIVTVIIDIVDGIKNHK